MCRMDVIAKYDMTADEDKGLVASINLPKGCSGGEFVMVPRRGPSSAAEAEEDDGWLVGHVTDEATMKSYVLVRACCPVISNWTSIALTWCCIMARYLPTILRTLSFKEQPKMLASPC